jgi:hypothetical protein
VEKLKILQISATYKKGGPGFTAAYVHEAVLQNGYTSRVFSATNIKEDFINSFENKWGTFFRKALGRLKLNTPITAFIQTNSI